MDWGLIIAVILIVLVGGSVVAVLWWKIAAGMAPYKDEMAKGKTGARNADVEEVVIHQTGGDEDGSLKE